MSKLEKQQLDEVGLHAMIEKIFESQSKFKGIKWRIVRKINTLRGENFDVEITYSPPQSSLAVEEFLEQIMVIKSHYWLVS